ncbi:MAG: type 4a pilus biogenesis protein PilO [candidate division Zixibacteria bacterium]|nr:type 4a pilus biogenesis protein PilO [candidate division Zixibacteria bacterium]
MDLKDPKIQRFLLGGLVIFLVIYFWYARIYSKNARLIEQKQVQYEYLLSDLKSVEMKARSFENLKEEYEKLFERYRKVERLLPEEKQIPLFLIRMHFAGRANRTGIMQILPQNPVPRSFYNTSSFKIEVTGSYHKLGNFLSSIANFPFLANVSDVTITALGEKEKSIAASLKLTTYYVKEEERLKKIEF